MFYQQRSTSVESEQEKAKDDLILRYSISPLLSYILSYEILPCMLQDGDAVVFATSTIDMLLFIVEQLHAKDCSKLDLTRYMYICPTRLIDGRTRRRVINGTLLYHDEKDDDEMTIMFIVGYFTPKGLLSSYGVSVPGYILKSKSGPAFMAQTVLYELLSEMVPCVKELVQGRPPMETILRAISTTCGGCGASMDVDSSPGTTRWCKNCACVPLCCNCCDVSDVHHNACPGLRGVIRAIIRHQFMLVSDDDLHEYDEQFQTMSSLVAYHERVMAAEDLYFDPSTNRFNDDMSSRFVWDMSLDPSFAAVIPGAVCPYEAHKLHVASRRGKSQLRGITERYMDAIIQTAGDMIIDIRGWSTNVTGTASSEVNITVRVENVGGGPKRLGHLVVAVYDNITKSYDKLRQNHMRFDCMTSYSSRDAPCTVVPFAMLDLRVLDDGSVRVSIKEVNRQCRVSSSGGPCSAQHWKLYFGNAWVYHRPNPLSFCGYDFIFNGTEEWSVV